MKKSSWLVFVFLLLQPCMSLGATVKQFSPLGRIDQQTRVSVKFSTKMVKLGDTTAPAPFVVNCGNVGDEGRWVDAANWAWQMKRPMKSGERCEFVLRSDLVALNGEALSGKNRFEFFVPGPWPRSVFPKPESKVDEDQAFIISVGGGLIPTTILVIEDEPSIADNITYALTIEGFTTQWRSSGGEGLATYGPVGKCCRFISERLHGCCADERIRRL